MNLLKKLALFVAFLGVGATLADSAFARGHRTRIGVFVGVPLGFGWPYWYGAPYAPYSYYYPPYPSSVVVVPQTQTYIQQESPPPAAPSAPSQGYWYYCADAQAYYPYVKECPAGWQRVTPQPPN